jgi:protein-tyrosine phosphatase
MAQEVLVPGTSLGIASVPNLRGAGGYMTADGSMVRRGVAYRANQLNPISQADLKKIAGGLPVKNPGELPVIPVDGRASEVRAISAG